MKNIGQLMKQAQEMQKKMAEMQDKMAHVEVTGVSGAGLVSVTLTGKQEMRALTIDPSLFNAEEKEVLEDLIIAAYHDAKSKSEAMASEEMSKLTGGMNIPGLSLPF